MATKRRTVKQTAAAKKSRSEAAKRAAATRLANRQAKEKAAEYREHVGRIEHVEKVPTSERTLEDLNEEAMANRARMRADALAAVEQSDVGKLAAMREAARILRRANLPVPEEMAAVLNVKTEIPAIADKTDEIQKHDTHARLRALEVKVNEAENALAAEHDRLDAGERCFCGEGEACSAPKCTGYPKRSAFTPYFDVGALKDALSEEDVADVVSSDGRLYTEEEIELLVEARINQDKLRVQREQEIEASNRVTRELKLPDAPVRVARVIRNLRTAVIHQKLAAVDGEATFRVNLRPRGERGDALAVPYGFQHDPQFQGSIGLLYEVITQTEARDLAYGPAGYNPTHREGVTVYRDADTVKTVGQVSVTGDRQRVSMERGPLALPGAPKEEPVAAEQSAEWLARQKAWEAEQRSQAAEERAAVNNDRPHGANPTFVNVAGSDTGLHSALNEASGVTAVSREESFVEEESGPAAVERRELSDQQKRMIAITEQAERAERAKIAKLERDGIIPAGALSSRVTVVRTTG